MPLSEHEQRLLDEMERNLYQNDADFVEPVSSRGRFDVAMLTLGTLIGVLGLGVVIVGVVIRQPLLGVLGFVVMLAGVLVAMRRGRGDADLGDPIIGGGTSATAPGQAPRFMDRLEERWQRRQDERDRF